MHQSNLRRRDLMSLGALGLLVLLTTSLYGLVIPLTPGRLELPSAALQDRTALWRTVRSVLAALAPSQPQVATVAVIVATAIAFLAYAAAVALLWRRPPSRVLLSVVVAVSVLLLLAGVLALPNSSTDIYDYLLTARVRTVHHANPLLVAPDTFSGDPLWPYASREYTVRPDNKLGIWVAFSLLPAQLAGQDPVSSLLGLRAALAVAGVVNLLLVALVLRRVAPRHVSAGTALYAWNPIVAVHTTAKADTLMVTFLLASLLLALTLRGNWATAMGVASMLVKVVSAPFLLVLLIGHVRHAAVPMRALATRLFVGVLLVLGTYQLFGRDPLLVVRHLQVANRPAWNVGQVGLTLAALGFAAVVTWAVLQQDGTMPTYLHSAIPLALYAAVVLGYLGFAWYLMVPLSIVALVRNGRAATAMMGISFLYALRNALDNMTAGSFRPERVTQLLAMPLVMPLMIALVLGAFAVLALAIVRRSPYPTWLTPSGTRGRTPPSCEEPGDEPRRAASPTESR